MNFTHEGVVVRETPDTAALLLGRVRAEVLRSADRNPTMGELAHLTSTARSVTTYHCEMLEEAGLLVRERQGQSVRVRRTIMGSALLTLLSSHFKDS
ncbi:hypothetical protein LFM09_35475 [Lentzea alba]|uniref:hypothetical protein n=1 Tax=Lentzea alba TaxID=2714351 RepID=UPI0039BFC60C